MHSVLDTDLAMAASISYSSILNEIQQSKLNFKIELSPFSAVITLKKTAIKDGSGASSLPPPPSSFLLHQAQQEIFRLSHIISDLENENKDLKCNHETSIDNSVKLCSRIDELKLEISRDKIKVEETSLNQAKYAENEILSLKEQNRKLEGSIQNFNSKLTETRSRLYKEKSESEKALKQEIKEWKKDLGIERKLRINAEKRLSKFSIKSRMSTPCFSKPESNTSSLTTASKESQSSEIVCYICAEQIIDYIPTLFLENEVNPACKNCKISFGENDEKEQFEEHSVANQVDQQEGSCNQTPPNRSMPIPASNLAYKAINSLPPTTQDQAMDTFLITSLNTQDQAKNRFALSPQDQARNNFSLTSQDQAMNTFPFTPQAQSVNSFPFTTEYQARNSFYLPKQQDQPMSSFPNTNQYQPMNSFPFTTQDLAINYSSTSNPSTGFPPNGSSTSTGFPPPF